MRHMKKLAALLLAAALIAALAGCAGIDGYSQADTDQQLEEVLQQISDWAGLTQDEPAGTDGQSDVIELTEITEPPEADEASDAPEAPDADELSPETEQTQAYVPQQDGYYYDVDSVVLYLHYYGRLPDNYITKSEARSLGWEGGSVEKYLEGAAIGGDNYGNFEQLLPREQGRKYTECDINTNGGRSRGAERLIFSNDGLYFYTDDHYESFTQLYVTDSGEVERK